MSTQRTLGETFERTDKRQWRVIRISNQSSLFEDNQGRQEVVTELVLELKSEDGQIDFEVVTNERVNYIGEPSPIKAPEPINWGREL